MALAAVRSLRTLHADATDGASPPGGDVPEELAVKGISGDDARDQRVSGLYSPDGTHSGKPVYKKVSSDGPRPLIYFHADEGKWTLGERLGEVEYRHDDSSLGPPLEQWSTSSGEPGLSVSVIPQMLQVEGADEDVTGTYVRCENFNDRPLFKCVGRQASVLKFDDGWWWIQKESGWFNNFNRIDEFGPPIGSWTNDALIAVFAEPFPRAPRFIWVQGAGEETMNGIYACTHSHHEKPRYVKVGGKGSIFFDDGWWKLGRESFGWGWLYNSWGRSTSVPPATGWTNEECPGDDPPPQLILQESYSASAPFIEALSQPGESSSQPPFLVVAGAGLAAVNGRYACVGSFGGEPKYKQLGGSSIIHYNCGRWQLNQQDSTSERYYDGPENRSPLPTSGWENLRSQDHPAPQVSLGTQHDLQTGDRVLMVKDDFDGFDFPPGSDELIIGSSPVRCSIGRLQGDFFSTEIHPTKLVPLGALGSIEFNRCWHCISDAQSASSAPSTQPSSPVPFLVVQGAGRAEVNGRYAYVGTFRDAPKYRQLGGTSIIFWTSGLWRLNHEENLNQRLYDGPADRTPLPTSGWDARHYPPAPRVSLGNHRDLQAGDRVKVVKSNDEVDWSRCPQSDRFTYALVPDSRTIARIEGDWWFNTELPEAISSLAQLGEVEFNDCWHCISAVERSLGSSASAPARAFGTSTAAGLSQAARQEEEQSAEPESGFDEEWCPDQDLERFRCCICMSVARNAMAHECGAVLFCEMCWVRCQAESDSCPVCREDGSSMAPAHTDRRLIRNLMIMCPNKCGESFPLCEKDKHIKGSCRKRQVKCTSCDRSYDANLEEEHKKECPARLVPCRLCGEEVRLRDMEAHLDSNPGRHFQLMFELLDKVASLEAEVKKLKGEA